MLEIHGKNEIIWNVTYSSWGPNNIDSDLKAQHLKSPDNLYVTPLYDSSILALSTDGSKKPARWVGHISSVAVNVFDVFRLAAAFSDSTLMLLPQPGFFPAGDDERLLTSAFVQRTEDLQWFAMSGLNFPSLVRSAPSSPWCERPEKTYASQDELFHSIIGVHGGLRDTRPLSSIPEIPKSHKSKGRLGIEGSAAKGSGAEFAPKFQYQYDYRNQVYRPSSEISRSSPPNPLPPTPPQPPTTDSTPKFRILSSILRILENALAFLVFFIFLLLAARYGWLNQVSGLADLTEKLKLATSEKIPEEPKQVVDEKVVDVPRVATNDEKTLIDSTKLLEPDSKEPSLDGTITPNVSTVDSDRFVSPHTPVTQVQSESVTSDDDKTPIASPRRVEIVEPEERLSLDAASAPGTPGVVKKRKRGSRGGRKSSAKKKEKEDLLLNLQLSSPELSAQVQDANITEVVPELSPSLQAGLLDVSTEVIGYGSHGTVVLKGTFENREVAVKRMLLDFYEVASQEVSLLQESDDNPNVIRYFCKQVSDRFLYIALELCPGTLEDLIEKPEKFSDVANLLTPTQILYQIASGVYHLHCLKIVHRDIKPQNILVAPPKLLQKNDTNSHSKEAIGPVRMLISDFGLCKKLEGDQSSFRATTANAAGTSGWRAPELLIDEHDSAYNHTILNSSPSELTTTGSSSEPLVIDSLSNRRATRAIDIFSMGCVFYYIMSNGQHPFGDKYLREANIVQGTFSLECLEDYSQSNMVEAQDLIGQMISRDPKQRPDAKEVLGHPLFWTAERRLDFLLKVSDRFDIEPRDPPSELLNLLEDDALKVVGSDWHMKLDKGFVDNLGKYRKYHGDKIIDLLRAMRNKSHHFNDLPADVRQTMEPYPEGYLAYFMKRFPFLLMTIYYVVKNNLTDEAMFKIFFP